MNVNYVLNWVSFGLSVFAAFFKYFQWPASTLIVLIALISLVISVILSYRANKRNGLNSIVNISIVSILVFIIINFTFRGLHLPAIEEVSYVLMAILAFLLIIWGRENKVSQNYWIAMLTYFMLSYLLTNFAAHRMVNELVEQDRKLENCEQSENVSK